MGGREEKRLQSHLFCVFFFKVTAAKKGESSILKFRLDFWISSSIELNETEAAIFTSDTAIIMKNSSISLSHLFVCLFLLQPIYEL